MLAAMNDDFPILAALSTNPTHPMALLEHLHAAGLAVSRSTLYRRVESLNTQGWVEADQIESDRGHYRRTLALSQTGRARVQAEATEILRSEPLESPLFSLAFAAVGDSDPELLAVLTPRVTLAARRLTDAERTLRESRCSDEGSRSARERRMAHLQSDIAWLRGLMAHRVVEPEPDGHAARRAS
jgi:DNA-binding PadR family transcriptional regulator